MKLFKRAPLWALLLCAAHCQEAPPTGAQGAEQLSIDELHERAVQALNKGELKEAESLAGQGLQQLRQESDSVRYWRFRLLLSEILIQLRQEEESGRLLEAEVPAGTEFDLLRCGWFLNQARLLISSGTEADLAKAETLLRDSREIAERLGAVGLLARIEARQGSILYNRAQSRSGTESSRLLAESDAAFRKSVELTDSLDAPELTATLSGMLGYYLIRRARFSEAVEQIRKALEASERSGNGYLVQKNAGNLGWCYFMLGDYAQSVELFKQAESMAGRLGNESDQLIWLGDLGAVLLLQGQIEQAISDFQRAFRMANELDEWLWAGSWLHNLASAHIRLENWQEAESYNRRAKEINSRLTDETERRDALLYSRLNEADILLAQQKDEGAKAILQEILGSQTKDQALIWEAEAALAGVFGRQKDTASAERLFERTLTSFEDVREQLDRKDLGLLITFQERRTALLQAYVDFLMESGKPARALEVVECSRSQVLAEGLGQDAKQAFEIKRIQSIARTLDAVLLSYWLAPRRSFVWAITGDELVHRQLAAQRVIEQQVDDHNAILSERDPLTTSSGAAARLYETLLGPLQDRLEDTRRVILVAHGPLHRLNFETLIVPGARRYWIDEVTVVMAPSLALLQPEPQLRQGSARKAGSYLVMGYSPPDDSLPEVEAEIQMIEDTLAPLQLRPERFIGREALPQNFEESLSSSPLLIHFAAHAEANTVSPLNSYVRLAERLYAHRVAATHIDARLVTVSTCRSAGAKAYDGEGLVGFSWAFLHAGAQNAVAGLGNISDRSSAQLMKEFYRRLADGESPAEALRQAKLKIRRDGIFRLPRHWSAFQLYTRSDPFIGLFEAN